MTPLYNQSGFVSGWLNDRNGRIVDLTGRHVAFLDGDSVYDYSGRHIA